jgi:threonine dehydrogenase-like Zn-dependent dehydrogenase
MKAAILRGGRIEVGQVPDPIPARGQALVRTHACGLCAADAHFVELGRELVESSRRFGGPYADLDFDRDLVMGHEFVGEIVEYGQGSRRPLPLGTLVTSIPVVSHSGGHSTVGQSHDYPGGYGEYMLLDEHRIMAIQPGVDPALAAMTEPMAVGLEHSRVGQATADDVVLVIGCGAIGLGVIVGLERAGLGPIVASDLNPARRDLAARMGADVVLDPRERSPYTLEGNGVGTPTLIYECVGAPGILNQIMLSAGFGARIVIGGYCLEPEQLYIPNGQNRRLKLFFAAGEEQQDLDLALKMITEGLVDVGSWVGARVGLSGVGDALLEMRGPTSPIRTVLDPRQL